MSASPRLEARHWRLAVISGMASYLDSGVIIATGLSLAIWQATFGWNPLQLGVISSTLTFSIAIGALFGGRIADRFGRRRVFNIDVLVYVVGVALMVFANDFAFLLVGVVVAGLAAGADLPTSVAVVAEAAPEGGQGRLVAFTQVMWSIGIAMTTLIGFAVSTLGITGIRIIFGHLAVIGVVTWLLRVFNPEVRRMEEEASARNDLSTTTGSAAIALPLREIFRNRTFVTAILLTGGFYVAWNLMANTIGQFKAYMLITIAGADQSATTAISFGATLLSIVGGFLFARIADTRLRAPLFFVGAIAQIIAMALGAITMGQFLIVMIAWLSIYSLAYPFAGEALYKVATQENFPVNARATVQGITYAASRFIVAGFAFVTPTIVNASPGAILWLLVGFAAAAAVIGSFLVRLHRVPGSSTGTFDAVPTAKANGR
ncbi:MFS transporter [Microbacterium sp. NPDC055683]